jgi:hypothetical protein
MIAQASQTIVKHVEQRSSDAAEVLRRLSPREAHRTFDGLTQSRAMRFVASSDRGVDAPK